MKRSAVLTRAAAICAAMVSLAVTAQAQQAPGNQPAAQGAQNEPALTSTALPGRQSWTSDRRDYHLGDIVTILVDEYTLTSLDKQVDATENRRHTLGLGINTPAASKTYGINTNNSAESETRGTDARTNRLTTEMSARVVAISANGLMQLKGNKAINVEKSKVNLTLTGWVRTQDVSAQNMVQSYRLADAVLDYQAEGPLGKAKKSIIGRLLGAFWP